MIAPATAQQRRRERQRRHIIEVAAQLFEENGGEAGGGLENTTTEMIAARADISPRTFFRYFDSKLDVIYIDYRHSITELLRLVEKRLATESVEAALLNGTIEHLQTFEGGRGNRERLLRALRSPQFAERRAVWLLQARDRLIEAILPHLRSRPEPPIQAGVLVGLVRDAMENALELWAIDSSQDLLKLFDRLVRSASASAGALQTAGTEALKGTADPRRRKARPKPTA